MALTVGPGAGSSGPRFRARRLVSQTPGFRHGLRQLAHGYGNAMVLVFPVCLCFVSTGTAAGGQGSTVRAAPCKPPAEESATVEHFPTAAHAIEKILVIPARIVAFGEYHQTVKTAAIRSSLSRFTDELLPMVAKTATDVVIETWVADGGCGREESHVVSEVETTTERPPETENEIVAFLRRAKVAGLLPHILRMSCRDYRFVTTKKGGIDFAKMLRLTRDRLTDEVLGVLDAKTAKPRRPTVVVYGGALHNDLCPTSADRRYAFGPFLFGRSQGQYVEVDLYVPEYIENDALIAEQPWYGLFVKNSMAGDALLIRRSERSFVVVFPRTRASK